MPKNARKATSRTISYWKRQAEEVLAERDAWRDCVIETFRLKEQISDDVDLIVVKRSADGHSGPGWYAWHAEYREEGALFLGSATAARPRSPGAAPATTTGCDESRCRGMDENGHCPRCGPFSARDGKGDATP